MTNHPSSRWSRSTSAEISHTDTVYPSSDGVTMAFYLWGLPLKNTKPQANLEKTPDKHKLRDFHKIIGLYSKKNVKVM